MKTNNFYFNKTAVTLLRQASFLEEPYFMCFGKHYYYLREFNFIDSEYNVTYFGRKFIQYCIKNGYLDEK